MKISSENAHRLAEIQQEMSDLLNEFKRICKDAMSPNEYQQFKYRTLGHIEPALTVESEWVTRYSSIDSLEKVALEAEDSSDHDDDTDEADDA